MITMKESRGGSHPVMKNVKGALRCTTMIIAAGVLVIGYQNCGTDFTPSSLTSASLNSSGGGDSSNTPGGGNGNGNNNGNGGGNGGGNSGGCTEDQLKAAFSTSYQLLLSSTSTCKACHIAGGAGKGAFASADTTEGYNAFKLVDINKINSYVVLASHAAGFSGPQNQAALDTAKTNWNNSVAACSASSTPPPSGTPPTGLQAVTTAKVIAATTTNKTISWNLNNELAVGSGNYGGATISIRIRTQTDATTGLKTYYLTSPTLTTGTSPITLTGIMVRINNTTITLATTFSRVTTQAPPATTNRVLSTATMLFEYNVQATDTLALQFSDLQAK